MPQNKHRQRERKDTYLPHTRCETELRMAVENQADKLGIKPAAYIYRVVTEHMNRVRLGVEL